MKVLHILYQSLPQISGSSIRSRDILMSQAELGIQVVAVTSPFQQALHEEENINGIRYLRFAINRNETISDNQKSIFKRILRFFKIFSFYTKLKKVVIQESPDVLHAHAMFFCGIPALILGNKYKLPVVYEVRSLWMLSKTNKRKSLSTVLIEKILFKLELFVMAKADVVIAINKNLKQVLIEGGIYECKIHIIKNAINTTLIKDLKQKIKKPSDINRLNFGYIGTLTPHEGIDLLINAFHSFILKNPNSSLFIYGTGIETKRIKEKVKDSSNIKFCGPISPDEVFNAFANIDVIVNPRYKNKLTDAVTPLKPLEAMAYEKIVIGSDVGGIKELITNQVNGFLFSAGDVNELIKLMQEISEFNQTQLNDIKKVALEYVESEKSWSINALKYKNLYETLFNKATKTF